MQPITVYRETFRRRLEDQIAEHERRRLATLSVVLSKLAEVGRRHPTSIHRLYLFGSLTRPGRFSPRSDIDVAVEWYEKGDYFQLWREVEEKVGREIDFRELGDDAFSRRVREQGLIAYES